MAGQMTTLLFEISREIKGVQTELHNLQAEVERKREQYEALLQRVTKLETDGDWTGKERRKVEKRLGSGDHTFLKLQSELANAEQVANAAHTMAKTALLAAEAARDGNRGTKKRGWKDGIKEEVVKALVPMAGTVVLWALYHLLLIGPEIAKLMKKVGP